MSAPPSSISVAIVCRKLLTLKFGPLSSEHERVISEASAEQLEDYVERVVCAAELDDVFAE